MRFPSHIRLRTSILQKKQLNRIILITFALSILISCESVNPRGMVLIPEGHFTLGLNPQNNILQFMSDKTSALNAQPEQQYFLEAFYIDKYEVTYEEFIKFKPQSKYPSRQSNLPISGISWYEADAYCQWLGKRLPTEYEWEKAARGKDNRLFVWGNDFEKGTANFGKQTKPVDTLEGDVSEYYIWGMNGNVSEWTANWYQPYPNSTLIDKNYGKQFKVTRGGAIHKREHGFIKQFALIPYRNMSPPNMRFRDTGFRCAKSV
jgi:formylglycine-generating enzyme required for sulfatase activity